MLGLRIPHGCFVLVANGAEALVLHNDGDETSPNLVVRELFRNASQTNAAPGAVRPEQTDWHNLAEFRFARHVAEAVDRLASSGTVNALVLVAPARTLAHLRKAFSVHTQEKIRAEIYRDLARVPIQGIGQLLTDKV